MAAAARQMRSSVNWTLLGLVIERPSYGLELATRFQRVYAEVLKVSGDSHVYKALDALESRAMIEMIPGTGFGRQPKPHYRATELGVGSYEDWLVEQVDVEAQRQELWVRQLSMFAHDPQAALQVLGRFERQYLKRVGQVGLPTRRPTGDTRTELIDDLVSEQQRIAVGGMLSWLRYTQALFEARVRKPADEPPPA
jgi:DNA-binding PadR family transcriptional regulator